MKTFPVFNDQQRSRPSMQTGKLFIGGIPDGTTVEALREYASEFGLLSDVAVMEGRGFAFVTFSDPQHAQAFLKHGPHSINGKRVDAKAAVPRSGSAGAAAVSAPAAAVPPAAAPEAAAAAGGGVPPSAGNSNSSAATSAAAAAAAALGRKLFVGGTGEVEDDTFRDHFRQFGEIEDCVVLRKEGVSRGFGFVTFADEASVERALAVTHTLNGKQVELKRAVRKEDMAHAAAVAAAHAAAAVAAAQVHAAAAAAAAHAASTRRRQQRSSYSGGDRKSVV